jgi:type I restriction enzyme R subunit
LNTNFHFLEQEWPTIYEEAVNAEEHVFKQPKYSAILSRSCLEKMVHWLYENDADLVLPYDKSLSSLIHDYSFKANINERIFREINLIRKIGNSAAHGGKVSESSSMITIKALHTFAVFLARYYGEFKYEINAFDESQLTTGDEEKILKQQVDLMRKQLEEQAERFKAEQAKLEERINASEAEKEKLVQVQQVATERKQERQQSLELNKAVPLNIPEAVTRKIYIDLLLQEAGWENLVDGRDLEYEVQGMPKNLNPSGKGYADYVLWGDNGLPLAVVEAKKAMIGSDQGRHQAVLYADCLEAMHGQRPIVFYTNGFESFIWDDQFSTPREVQGFYTKDELQLMIDRRTSRKELTQYQVKPEITDRYYQIEAVQRVAERISAVEQGKLVSRHRRALLVMATGSGKTRTSASIIDMLTKSNWAKRVLFLADRNALVTQAKNSISSMLPNLSAIDLTKEKEDNGTRLVFSTYPTIMNKIDGIKNENERFYGVGHFDVIFIDEAHRSVYQKYKAIFDYFDAIVIGLTATPKKDVDHNTYGLFEIEDDIPTYSYELNKAVEDKYLVPAKGISVPIKFMREGIKYKDLTDAEKVQFEEKFGDPSNLESEEEIGSEAMYRWLFNTDTVDKVLAHLMNDGIKVEGGDQLGKTIIFAKNHAHAQFIEKRFNLNYPEKGGRYLRVIDNYEPKAQDLLDRFTNDIEEEEPQIAVSVDMMDTGVDAPRVVNLVFFKMVKSASKYWQMIGRGTRLRPNLFGPGQHKKEFLIFDYCENFEFFDEFPEGMNTYAARSVTERKFDTKLEIVQLLNEQSNLSEADAALRSQYLEELYESVASLNQDRFMVRQELRLVNEFCDRKRWDAISKGDMFTMSEKLSRLVLPDGNDELARRFDLITLMIQLCMIKSEDDTKYANKVMEMSTALKKLSNVPIVNAEMPMILKVSDASFWNKKTLQSIEEMRISLRDLIKFIEKETQEEVYTAFADDLDEEGIQVREVRQPYANRKSYQERVERHLRENKDYLVIHKITHNVPISEAELKQLEAFLFKEDIGTKEEYTSTYGEKSLVDFIRSILGLDIEAANKLFAEFLNSTSLKADQMTFINRIIQFLTVNGSIDKKMLVEPPFTDLHDQGIFGIFGDANAAKIIDIVGRFESEAN